MMSNSGLYLLASIALAMVVPTTLQGQTLQTAIPRQAQQAAAESLETLRALAAPAENFAKLGLKESREAERARLGDPMPDYVIDLTALRAWNGDNPKSLLRPTGQFIYPITVDGVTRTSVTIARVNGEWTAASFGPPDEAQARSQIQNDLKAKSGQIIQVRVPALNAVFVARQADDTLKFTPVVSQPRFDLTAGRAEPAKQVLLRMQPAAKALDTSVPH